MSANVPAAVPFGRGVIYTALTGKKDCLGPVAYRLPNVSYICFTDDAADTADGWTMRPIAYRNDDPTRVAKHPKILPHIYLKPFDWSLWIDANFEITGDLSPLIREHVSDAPFHALRHHARSSIFEEVDACLELRKDDPALLLRQAKSYRNAGLQDPHPLFYCGILLRRHREEAMITLARAWWREIQRFSRRDQVSLPYALAKNPVDARYFFGGGPPSWTELPYLARRRHERNESHPWEDAPQMSPASGLDGSA